SFDIFMRALPFSFRNVAADLGAVVTLTITGEAGGSWHLEKRADGWQLIVSPTTSPMATVTIGQDSAWKMLTKRRSREAKLQQFAELKFQGDRELGLCFLDVVAVMA